MGVCNVVVFIGKVYRVIIFLLNDMLCKVSGV